MEVGDKGLALIKEFEGLRLEAYPDPASGGEPWTIGYGHTAGVTEGMVITEDQANNFLLDDCDVAGRIIETYVLVALNQNQFDALVSFVFNIGPGVAGERDGFVWLRNGNHSTLLRKLNSNDMYGASQQFRFWANPPLPGLIRRRKAEEELFLTPT